MSDNRTRTHTQHTCWVFTLNFSDDGSAPSPPSEWEGVQYIVYQEEVAPATGRHHYQGYVVLKRKAGLSTLKQRYGTRIHWEPRRGSHQQARDYSTKEETRAPGAAAVEVGTPPSPGTRSDIHAAVAVLHGGGSMRELAEEHPGVYVRYFKGLHAYRDITSPPKVRTWHTHVTIYWGPSGTGKSRRAFHEAGPDAYIMMKPNCKTVWFSGYTGQENIVFDEFYGWCPRDLMQRLCDRYPLLLQTGNGLTTQCLARRIWITSNANPESWWSRIGFGAMTRRVRDHGECVYMDTGVWAPPASPSLSPPASGGPVASSSGSGPDSDHPVASSSASAASPPGSPRSWVPSVRAGTSARRQSSPAPSARGILASPPAGSVGNGQSPPAAGESAGSQPDDTPHAAPLPVPSRELGLNGGADGLIFNDFFHCSY